MIEQRVKTALLSKGISVNKLSQMLGMNQATLNNQIRGASPLTVETIEKILPYLDDISAEWILREEGKMEKNTNILKNLGNCCGDSSIFNKVNINSDADEWRERCIKLEAEREKLLNIIDKLTNK